MNKIEKVQRYFTKRVAGLWNISYDDRLRTLSLQSLEHRRVLTMLFCYKIKSGLIDIKLN